MIDLKFEDLIPVLESIGQSSPIAVTANTVAAAINDPTKAPGRFPYPLDTILEDFADAYLKLQNASAKLKIASHDNVALSIEQRQGLQKMKNQVAMCAKIVRETAVEIDLKYKLDN